MTKVASKHSLMPTPERGQHGETIKIIETAQAGVVVAKVGYDDSFKFYYRRGMLGSGVNANHRYQVGLGWRQDWSATGREPSVVGMYGEWMPGTGDAGSASVGAIAAERRYSRAASRLAKAGLLDLMLSIAVMGDPVCGHWRKRGRHMERLREGLDMLKKIY